MLSTIRQQYRSDVSPQHSATGSRKVTNVGLTTPRDAAREALYANRNAILTSLWSTPDAVDQREPLWIRHFELLTTLETAAA